MILLDLRLWLEILVIPERQDLTIDILEPDINEKYLTNFFHFAFYLWDIASDKSLFLQLIWPVQQRFKELSIYLCVTLVWLCFRTICIRNVIAYIVNI